MEIEIIEKKMNPLLKRQEIWFNVHHKGATPARDDVKNKLTAMLNAKPELVIIERMRSEFGIRKTRGYAKIYKSKKELDDIERAHIVQRNAPKVKEAPKEVEKAPEEAKPKEEKVEAPKEEVAKVEKPEEAKATEDVKPEKPEGDKEEAEVVEKAKAEEVKEEAKKPEEEKKEKAEEVKGEAEAPKEEVAKVEEPKEETAKAESKGDKT